MNSNDSPNGSRLTDEQAERLREVFWAIQDPEVKRNYPDKVVAVFQRKIIASGDDEETVLAEAQRITGQPKHQIAITAILGPEMMFSTRD